jgi:hypothetical protein
MVAPVLIFAIGNESRGDDALAPLLARKLHSYLNKNNILFTSSILIASNIFSNLTILGANSPKLYNNNENINYYQLLLVANFLLVGFHFYESRGTISFF